MAKSARAASQSSPDYDVAIVGGGVSGIYSGWRLVTAGPGKSGQPTHRARKNGRLKIAVFEGSDRIGGRLLSARPPGFTDSTTCEIGGMRYVSSQTLVRSLVENELKLPRYEQVVYNPDTLVYLRGKRLRFSQVQDPAALPYDLEWSEAQFVAKNNPAGLIAWALGKLLPGVNQFQGAALHEYLRNASIDGTPLYQHGFWNLLARALSQDAYSVARTLIGYDCLGSNANAVDLICEIYDFTPDVKYYLLNEGYETVPWTLQQKFEKAGGEVIHGAWVAGFDRQTLDDGTTGVVLRFRGDRPPVTARALILAMPRRSIELLQREGPVLAPALAPHVPHLLNAVRPIPLYKLFLAYEYPWWNAVATPQDKPLQGRSLTDTPVRQLYYWPVDPGATSPPTAGPALLMAYNDATNVDFWEGLSGSGEPPPHSAKARLELQHFRKIRPTVRMYESQARVRSQGTGNRWADRLRTNWLDHDAPHEMVMEMHRQIARMHDVEEAPKPVHAAYMDWAVDPYGGGVHFWNRGYKSWEVLRQMTQPVADFPCYICGEAYSTNQTWVEGALQTAEIVLQTHFGLAKPSWVTPNPRSSAGAPQEPAVAKTAAGARK
jgi:Flavin containing amine oxidoreductase